MSAAVARPQIVLACCSDAGYAPYAATMLLSALDRTRDADFVVHYLHDPDFPEATQQAIRQGLSRHAARLTLHFVEVPDDWVAGLPLFGFMKPGLIRPVMWYRIFLPRLLPAVPKILYLDCDTIAVDSLLPLWNTALGDKALAAVTNPWWSNESELSWYKQCGLERREDYFNSGVMLLNLEAFRTHGWSEAVLAHGRENGHWTKFGDQDSLVAVLHAQRLPLPPRWNVMRIVALSRDSHSVFTRAEMRDVMRRPAVIHFEGSTKPWVDATKHPWGRLHARYARQLPWPVHREPLKMLDVENFLVRRNWTRVQRGLNWLRFRLRSGLVSRR